MIPYREMSKRVVLVIALLLNVTILFAQQTFKYRAVLQKVDTSGFYTIALSPKLLALCQPELQDIRLFDQHRKITPYLFGNELPVKTQETFLVFPQVKTVNHTDTTTTFIAENKNRITINQLYLTIRNTAVSRKINLSGSDDMDKWYAITENLSLANNGQDTSGTYQQLLTFPASTYRYYKIQIINGRKEPVAVLQAGIYKRQEKDIKYDELPQPAFKQTDTVKISTVIIRFNEAYAINKISLDLTAPKFYERKINISIFNGQRFEFLTDAIINSSNGAVLLFPAKTKAVKLDIFNEDNPPLIVKSIKAYSLTQSIIAYLEKGTVYDVVFGDSTAVSPNYDLRFFIDSLQTNLLPVKISAISANPLYSVKQVKKQAVIPQWTIWLTIITVILILGVLTFKMTREVNYRGDNS